MGFCFKFEYATAYKKSSLFYIHRKFFSILNNPFQHQAFVKKSEKKRASNSVTVHEADSKQFRHWSSQVYTKDVFWSIVRWFLKQNSVSRPPEHLAAFSVGFGGDFGSSFFISSCLPRRGSGYFFFPGSIFPERILIIFHWGISERSFSISRELSLFFFNIKYYREVLRYFNWKCKDSS